MTVSNAGTPDSHIPRLNKDTVTRFDSTLAMVKEYLAVTDNINTALTHLKGCTRAHARERTDAMQLILTPTEVSAAQQLEEVLRPFALLTSSNNRAGSAAPSLGVVCPSVRLFLKSYELLRQKCAMRSTDRSVALRFIDALRDELELLLHLSVDDLTDIPYFVSTYPDPYSLSKLLGTFSDSQRTPRSRASSSRSCAARCPGSHQPARVTFVGIVVQRPSEKKPSRRLGRGPGARRCRRQCQ